MPHIDGHDRSYMQARLREEIARCRRFGGKFTLLMVEEMPSTDGLTIRRKLIEGLRVLQRITRSCDVVAHIFDDTIAVLLVETDSAHAKAALLRIQNYLARWAGVWAVSSYSFPEQEADIVGLSLLQAA